MRTASFRTMGTTVTILLEADSGGLVDAALARAQFVFAEVERTCSRFDSRSELSMLNRLGSARVSPLLAEVVELALAGRERTGGRFDPTVHDAVVAAGYDRDLAEVRVLPGDRAPLAPAPAGHPVRIEGDRIVLGRGTSIDLGGIAKGFAVDRACAVLRELGPCLVDAGGDVAVRGSWPVAVDGGPTLELTDCAVATSGRDRRRWDTRAGELHHLIDPQTGRPAETDTLRVSVVAETAVEAEVLAKAAFLGGPVDAPTVRVRSDGAVELDGGLR